MAGCLRTNANSPMTGAAITKVSWQKDRCQGWICFPLQGEPLKPTFCFSGQIEKLTYDMYIYIYLESRLEEYYDLCSSFDWNVFQIGGSHEQARHVLDVETSGKPKTLT